MLQNLRNLFNKKNDDSVADQSQHNWYSDRYESLLTQRNIFIVLLILSFAVVIVSVFAVGKISTSKTFSPFVIQIEERTGAAKVVNPANSDLLGGNEAMSRYFIKKYISARETYNPVDYELNVRKVVRLFSVPEVYRDFISYVRNPLTDPSILYGQRNTTSARIKSFSRLGSQYFVRFAVIESSGEKRVMDKIATITIGYQAMELSEEDRDVNPVGFQITGYRVDDDNS